MNNNVYHTLVVAVAATISVASLSSCAGQKNENPRPVNIIHIMTDDHSFQTISAYGHPLSKIANTPNIDRLAKEGMVFTHAYVENAICAPSRATLLTGRYSHRHGQRTLGKGFDTTQVVFPELLQRAGYQTALIGKWHLKVEPKGFDYYKILHEQGDYYNPEFRTPETNGEYIREEGYATTLITDHSLEWLAGRDKRKPFCLLLHHKAPHRNWMPEEQYLDLYEDVELPYPETLFDDYATRGPAAQNQEMNIAEDLTMSYDLKVDQLKDQEITPWIKKDWDRAMERMNPTQLAHWNNAYGPKNEAFLAADMSGEELVKWKYQRYVKDYLRVIKSVDDQIGRVLDYLDENGLTENTIVVYTSDQGFYMGEHGWFDKRFMYEESFRTPLLIRYPPMTKGGNVCNDLVQNIDFAPTYLDLAGVGQGDMDGTSLAPVLSGTTPADWRDMLYYQYYDYPAIHRVRKHYGVRTKDYKLIHFYGPGKGKEKGDDIDYWELYDMKKDPTEVQNVYDNPAYREIRKGLYEKLLKTRENLGNPE